MEKMVVVNLVKKIDVGKMKMKRKRLYRKCGTTATGRNGRGYRTRRNMTMNILMIMAVTNMVKNTKLSML